MTIKRLGISIGTPYSHEKGNVADTSQVKVQNAAGPILHRSSSDRYLKRQGAGPVNFLTLSEGEKSERRQKVYNQIKGLL